MTNFLYYFSIWIEAAIGIANRKKKLLPNSVIIVHGYGVGANSHSFVHADMAWELYRRNKNEVAYIIPSGFDSNPDIPKTEGAEMADYLTKKGVPPSIILTEKEALTTPENIARTLFLFKKLEWDVSQYSFVSVHHPSYVWKSRYIWKLLGFSARGVAARCSVISSLTLRHHKELGTFLKEPFEIKKAHERATNISKKNIKPLTKEEFLTLKQ